MLFIKFSLLPNGLDLELHRFPPNRLANIIQMVLLNIIHLGDHSLNNIYFTKGSFNARKRAI